MLGLAAFAALEIRTAQPLLRVERLADRAIGGGFLMMLLASAVPFGGVLLSSLCPQNLLGAGTPGSPLAVLPFALGNALGVHAARHPISHARAFPPLAGR